MTAPNQAEILHPVSLAAARLPDLDPAVVTRVREELHAGALTRERVLDAVHVLAGLGHVVEVRVYAVEEVDGEWSGAGRVVATGRAVWFPLHEVTATELVAHLATDPEILPIAAIAAVDLELLPAAVLG